MKNKKFKQMLGDVVLCGRGLYFVEDCGHFLAKDVQKLKDEIDNFFWDDGYEITFVGKGGETVNKLFHEKVKSFEGFGSMPLICCIDNSQINSECEQITFVDL